MYYTIAIETLLTAKETICSLQLWNLLLTEITLITSLLQSKRVKTLPSRNISRKS